MKSTKPVVVLLTSVFLMIPLNAVALDESTSDEVEADKSGSDEPKLEADTSLEVKHKNQIMAGLGLMVAGFVSGDGFGGGGSMLGDGLAWINIPITYHRRLNDVVAVGGGLMIHILAGFGIVPVMGSLMGGVRFYTLKDFLWFDLNLLLGFPVLLGFAPAIGHNFPVSDKVQIYVKNEFIMAFPGMFVGVWQPSVGVDVRF